MANSRGRSSKSVIVAAALSLTAASFGCGGPPEEGDDAVAEGALKGLVINCPTDVTVDWIQAANGRKNVLHGKTRTVVPRDQPITILTCKFDPDRPPLIEQLVSLGANTVDSACAAKATVSGQGTTSNSVPPFEPFVFKSKRIQAVSAYDPPSGNCLLTIPVLPLTQTTDATPEFSLKVTQGCKTLSDFAFICPTTVQQVR